MSGGQGFNQQNQQLRDQVNVAGDLNVFEGERVDVEGARRMYLEMLRQRCHVLPLAAMGGGASTTEQVRLDQVYVDLDTTTRVALTEAEKAARKEQRLHEQGERPLAALDAATQETRLVLLGDPGAGKSTFVRQLAAWLAGANLGVETGPDGWAAETLPLLVTLRDLAPRLQQVARAQMPAPDQKTALVAAIRAQWQVELEKHHGAGCLPLLDQMLQRGNVLLIFDGLDETPEDARGHVRNALDALLESYPRVGHVLVTCRSRSYVGAAVLPGFVDHTLAPFTRQQIRGFVQGWYGAQAELGRLRSEDIGSRQADLTNAALAPTLFELAVNPMLLTTMAIIHQEDVGLPRQRVRLYERAVQVLLLRWQSHKGVDVAPALAHVLNDGQRMRRIVERLAHASHKREAASQGDLTRADALLMLEEPNNLGDFSLANHFLDYVDRRAGLLVGEGGAPEANRPHTYRFAHRTFQEYLTACQLVDGRGIERTFRVLAAEGDFWYLAAQLGAEELFHNRRNDTALLDLMYRLCAHVQPQSEQEWRCLVWSGQMARLVGREAVVQDDDPDGGSVYLQRLTGRLVDLVAQTQLTPRERADAGAVLGIMGDPRPGVGLKNGAPDIEWCEIAPGPFVMGSDKKVDGDAHSDETPQFTCTLIQEPYCISRYPITVAQYGAFVAAGGYESERFWTQAGWRWRREEEISGPESYGGEFETPNHPQVGVSWYEAMAYCAWLSEVSGQEVRLPTEAEWERAARGPSTGSGPAQIYPWPGDFDAAHCNMSETGIGVTSAVGIFPSGNAKCGAADMAGNVWEWTQSCYGTWNSEKLQYEDVFNYPYVIDDGRENLNALHDVGRVLRGGAFGSSRGGMRCAYRDLLDPRDRDLGVGLRVVSPGLCRAGH
ncbi:MAG: SUMF1/EgtB/PvdO family nonheme iron enzyme [Caldilineaceae bacterium]|nr:SUMF1/EgtB/PvdO family nonheme iron enzyme [Caldilineaceae bacterium]